MLTEIQIRAAMRSLVDGTNAPPVPLEEIRGRINTAPSLRRPGVLAAIAALIILAFALPSVAPGFVQTLEEHVAALLHWTPPPPPPASIESSMRSKVVTLSEAAARVDFTVVPPAGLPHDVVSREIIATPTAVYTYASRRWSVGSPALTFFYRRSDGRVFTLQVARFDPREGPPSKYHFLVADRNGRELIVRHDNFTWRNGNQVTSAIADENLSAAEIERIRSAMLGLPIDGVWPPQRGSIVKQFRIKFP